MNKKVVKLVSGHAPGKVYEIRRNAVVRVLWELYRFMKLEQAQRK